MRTKSKKENSFLSLTVNIVIPVIILIKFSGDGALGQVWGLVAALAFPIVYGFYDFWKRRHYNFFSILGLVSIVLTGGVGLLNLGPQWLAVKEAGVPLFIGLAVIASHHTRYSLVRLLFDQAIDHDKVERAIQEHKATEPYQKRLLISTRVVAVAFFLSAILNYTLAKIIVVSPAGTEAFNQELGKMTALSFPIIAIPTLILLVVAMTYFLMGVEKMTGMETKDMLK